MYNARKDSYETSLIPVPFQTFQHYSSLSYRGLTFSHPRPLPNTKPNRFNLDEMSLDVKSWGEVVKAYNEFNRIYPINSLNTNTGFTSVCLSSFNTGNIDDFYYLFSNNPDLISIDLGHINLSKINRAEYMFSNCKKLELIDFSKCKGDLDLSNVNYKYFGEHINSNLVVLLPISAQKFGEHLLDIDNFIGWSMTDREHIQSTLSDIDLYKPMLYQGNNRPVFVMVND